MQLIEKYCIVNQLYETCTTLHRLRMFESRVLGKVLRHRRGEVTVEWRRLYCQLIAKYYSGNQINKYKMGGACKTYGEEESCTQGFGGET